jgi:hypothetical protein
LRSEKQLIETREAKESDEKTTEKDVISKRERFKKHMNRMLYHLSEELEESESEGRRNRKLCKKQPNEVLKRTE